VRAAALAGLVALLVAGLALATPRAAQPPSGLYGNVTRGPITPVCQVGIPCDGPAAHATFLLIRLGKSTRVRTDGQGHYRVRLAPGSYTITKPDWGPGSIRPASARVPRGRFARLNLFIDTGIR
jgi:hypothetical protein